MMVLGFIFSTALARSEKAEEKANDKVEEKRVIKNNEQTQDQTVNKGSDNSKVNENRSNIKIDETEEVKNKIKDIKEVSREKSDKIEETGRSISRELKEVAARKTVMKEELNILADELVENQALVADSVGKFENKNKVKTFFMGTDYKNLGQLRSSMVQNRNQIRQLTQLIGQTEDEEVKTALQEQLATMVQERDEINNLIKGEESTFSLFGWAFRLINGYSKDSSDSQEELELQKEVEEALVEDETEREEGTEIETEPQTVI